MARRRLASCALLVILCQVALVFAAPVSSCCPPRHASTVDAEKDCCPAGSHAPGECPLHARNKSKAASQSACRMLCDAPHGVQFLIGAIGVLPSPVASPAPLTAVSVISFPHLLATRRPALPDSPPPRVL